MPEVEPTEDPMPAPTLQSEPIRRFAYSCPVDHQGTVLSVRAWQMEKNTGLPVLILHDFGESLNLLRPVAQIFVEHCFNTYGFNMRGHNRQGRPTSKIPHFKQLVLDLLQIIAWVRHKEKGVKPLLVCKGMSTLVALNFSREYGQYIQGVVYLSPLFELPKQINAIQKFIIATCAELLPDFILPQWLTPAFLAANSIEQKNQPKTQFSATARFTLEFLQVLMKSKQFLVDLDVPSLFVCSDKYRAEWYETMKKTLGRPRDRGIHDFITLDKDSPQFGICNQVFEELVMPWLKESTILSSGPMPTFSGSIFQANDDEFYSHDESIGAEESVKT
jgi:pimeloyl-ACP methyl ester carboxylesterase